MGGLKMVEPQKTALFKGMQQLTLPILCHFPETSRKNQVLQTTASNKPPEKVEGGVQNKA